MNIKWLGHSCFLLTSEAGVRLLMDPMDPETGYSPAPVEADVVTASHNHHDHNYFALASGSPTRITDAGVHEYEGVRITGIPTWHDDAQGAKRGSNLIYLVEMDGIRLLHAGDLGHIPDAAALAAIGRVDVLMTPVGGVYTITGREAWAFAQALHPKVIIPMHYRTEVLRFALDELTPFLDCMSKGYAAHRLRQSEATLTAESLGADRVLVLEYDRAENGVA